MTWTPPSPEEEVLFPFPGRAGRGVRADGSIVDGDFSDRLGHGTAVMAVIQERAPEAEYFAVRVFDGRLQATAQALFRAIEWAIEQRMHIVNLSLGTANQAHADRFAQVSAKAVEQSVSLISASQTYPGRMHGVVAVNLDETCERTRYRAVSTA